MSTTLAMLEQAIAANAIRNPAILLLDIEAVSAVSAAEAAGSSVQAR